MWRSRFPFCVKEAPHWLHWNGLSPISTVKEVMHWSIKQHPFTPRLQYLCGCACAPSARWVRCRPYRTSRTGASRWVVGWVPGKRYSGWEPRYNRWPLAFRDLRPRGRRRPPSLGVLCRPVTRRHCRAPPWWSGLRRGEETRWVLRRARRDAVKAGNGSWPLREWRGEDCWPLGGVAEGPLQNPCSADAWPPLPEPRCPNK